MKNLKTKSLSFFKKFWPYLLIVGFVVLFFWKVFLKGLIPLPADFVVGVYFPWLDYKWAGYLAGVPVKNPITTDVVSFMYPMQTFAISQLMNKTLPLWNPYILSGMPLMANFQSAPFSPVNIFYFFLDPKNAWTVQIILQHFFAALFTFLLLRRFKVSKLGSILGGLIYAFGGYSLIWSQWNGHTLTASFIPLIIYLFDLYLDKANFLTGIFISLTVLLIFVSGYPQTFIYLLVACGIYWLIVYKHTKSFWLKTISLLIYCLLGVGLSLFQILPGYELLNNSQRIVEPHPFEWAFLPYKKIITFIAPDFFGNHATKNWWGPQDYTSNTGFVGVIGLFLAIISSFQLKKNKKILYGVIIAVVSLLLSFATPLSIFLWKSGFLGLNAASAHRALILFVFGMSILASFGYDLFYSKFKIKVISFLVCSGLIAGFGLYAFTIGNIVGVRNLVIPSFLILASAFLAVFRKYKPLFLILLTIELFYFGWKFTPFSEKAFVFPETPVIEYLKNIESPYRVVADKVIPINFLMNYKISTVEGYDAVYPLRISKLLAAINGRRSGTDPLGRYGTIDDDVSQVLDMMGAKYNVVLRSKLDFYKDYPKFKKVFEDKSVVVLENKNVLPRAFVVCDWDVEPDERNIIDKLLSTDFDFAKKIILEESVDFKKCQRNKSEVSFENYSANSVKINVKSDNDGFLFLSDTYYPGWKAYLNGEEVKIYRANFALRAVFVPKGESTVEFVYKPESFWKGLLFSKYSLVVLILFSIVVKRYTTKINEK